MAVTKVALVALVRLVEYAMKVGPGSEAGRMLTYFYTANVNGT